MIRWRKKVDEYVELRRTLELVRVIGHDERMQACPRARSSGAIGRRFRCHL
jgi:hypothetical protein